MHFFKKLSDYIYRSLEIQAQENIIFQRVKRNLQIFFDKKIQNSDHQLI